MCCRVCYERRAFVFISILLPSVLIFTFHVLEDESRNHSRTPRYNLRQLLCRSEVSSPCMVRRQRPEFCTSCVLFLHKLSYCATCFVPVNNGGTTQNISRCNNCHSYSHGPCLSTEGSPV